MLKADPCTVQELASMALPAEAFAPRRPPHPRVWRSQPASSAVNPDTNSMRISFVLLVAILVGVAYLSRRTTPFSVEDGRTLQLIADITVALAVVGACILAVVHICRGLRVRERAIASSERQDEICGLPRDVVPAADTWLRLCNPNELFVDVTQLQIKPRRHLLVQNPPQALLKRLNDISDMSKVEDGLLDLTATPSDVVRDLAQCVRLMTPMAEQKGLTLRATFAGGFPDSVLIDSVHFREIVLDLLGNAIKLTEKGTVSLTLGEVSGLNKRRIMTLEVADARVWVADARKSAIFDTFVQTDESITRRFGHPGAGLSISRRLARLMGGTIALDSRENGGTVITFALPLDEIVMPVWTQSDVPVLALHLELNSRTAGAGPRVDPSVLSRHEHTLPYS